MTTNGLLLNQEIIDFIKEKQIILSLSWDGNQKANDINRVDLYRIDNEIDVIFVPDDFDTEWTDQYIRVHLL
ncbi:MAG: hypothetical protein IJF03_00525 [Lachnospiraceae bacterium]|nr:hypothetical protein [Lachnospiraceae bacterium]